MRPTDQSRKKIILGYTCNVHLTQFIAIESMGEVATRCVSQLVDEPFRDSYITWLTS